LTTDGFGNSWFLDIDDNGNWKEVYFVGYSPALVIKVANSLSEFLIDINAYSNDKNKFSLIKDYPINDILKSNDVQIHSKENTILDLPISEDELPNYFKIFDFTSKENMLGFYLKSWQDKDKSKVIRVKNKPIWILEYLKP